MFSTLAAMLVALGLASSSAEAQADARAHAPAGAHVDARAEVLTRAEASDACVPSVVVEGHGVPAHVTDELRALAPTLSAIVSERIPPTSTSSCAPIHVSLLPAIEGASELDPPWRLPSWAAGAAVPGERRVVIAITASGRRQERERVLLHELAHVAVRDASNGNAPRWLDEGAARVIAGEHGVEDLAVLARARVSDRMLPLAALDEGFPGRSDLASLAYAQSGRAVALIESHGEGALVDVLLGLAAKKGVDDALHDAIGRRLWQLELDVERSIPLWRAWAVLGWETDLALAGAALVCAWAGVRARRRIRERLVAMDDDVPRPVSLGPPVVVLRRWTVPRASPA